MEKNFKYIVAHLIEYFGQIGGFAVLLDLLKIEEGRPLIPIKCIDIIFRLFSSMLEFLEEGLKSSVLKTLKETIEMRFSSLTDKEIKDFDKDFASNFIYEAKTLLMQHYPEQTIHQFVETMELDLALKYLKSSFFEKRIKGVNEIKEISERIEYTESHLSSNDNYYYQISRKRYVKYLTSEIFLKWLCNNKVVEILLGDSMHVEIVKRCHDILIFMCKHKYMPADILNHIWAAGEGKHDSLVRVLYEMIIEISAYLTPELLNLLYEKIKAIPLADYVELTLNLVKGFTENVIRINMLPSKYSLKYELPDDGKPIEEQFYGVELLWNAIIDSSPLENNLIEMAMGHIKSIASLTSTGPLRVFFMGKALEEIKNGQSMSQSLTIVMDILNYYLSQREVDSSFKKIHQMVKSQGNLIDLLIKDLKRYQKLVQNSMQSSSETSLSYLDKVYEGKFSHKTNLDKRLKTLETLIQLFTEFKEPLFTNEHLTELWGIFVKNGNHEMDKRIYCSWLMKKDAEGTNNNEINIILPAKTHMLHQFNNILCDKQQTDFFNLCEEEFECFSHLFKLVNYYEQKIKLTKAGKFLVVEIDLTGKNDLWDIFLNCNLPKIMNCAGELLVTMHLQFHTNVDRKKKKEIQDGFTVKCINLLKQSFSNQNFSLLNKAISLIINFFDKFEGKSSSTSSSVQRQGSGLSTHQISVTVHLKPDDVKKEIKINYMETMGSFRRKISEEFKILPRQFCFVSNTSINLDSNENVDDETLLREYCWNGTYVISRIKKKDENSEENYHPKKLISDNPEYLDLLFMVLSNPNSGFVNNTVI